MSLLTIAEVLAGETLVSPGGPVDRETAIAEDVALYEPDARSESALTPDPSTVQEELALV